MNSTIQPGTVSAGTLRSEDLIQSFSDELAPLVVDKLLPFLSPFRKALRWHSLGASSRKTCAAWTQVHTHTRLLREARGVLETAMEEDPDAAELMSEIVSELMDALNSYAPPNMYFGSIEGDGADFGWWAIDTDEEVIA